MTIAIQGGGFHYARQGFTDRNGKPLRDGCTVQWSDVVRMKKFDGAWVESQYALPEDYTLVGEAHDE
jgi:hypothetical protein